MKRLILARHGRSYPWGLTDDGIRSVRKSAEEILNHIQIENACSGTVVKIDAVFSTDTCRTQESAEIFARLLEIEKRGEIPLDEQSVLSSDKALYKETFSLLEKYEFPLVVCHGPNINSFFKILVKDRDLGFTPKVGRYISLPSSFPLGGYATADFEKSLIK